MYRRDKSKGLVRLDSLELKYYRGFRVGGTGNPKCLLYGGPYKPPTLGIVPSTLNPL